MKGKSPMVTRHSRTQDFWQQYDRQIKFAKKDELHKSGETFNLVGVSYQATGRFGAQWILTAEMENGETQRIGFSDNEVRSMKFEDLKEFLAEEPNSYLSAKMIAFETKNGQIGYDIAPVDYQPELNETLY